MISQIRTMLNSIGIGNSLRMVLPDGELKFIGECSKGFVSKINYRIEICGSAAGPIRALSSKFANHQNFKTKHQNYFYNNYSMHTLTLKKHILYNNYMYGLETENNQSFVVNDILVKNNE